MSALFVLDAVPTEADTSFVDLSCFFHFVMFDRTQREKATKVDLGIGALGPGDEVILFDNRVLQPRLFFT